MANNIEIAKEKLESNENINFVLINTENEVYCFESVDIDLFTDIIDLIESEKDNLINSVVATRKLDRGTAFLLSKIETLAVYSKQISRLAIEVIEKNDIEFTFDEQIEYIKDELNSMFVGEQWTLHIHEKEINHALWYINQKLDEV